MVNSRFKINQFSSSLVLVHITSHFDNMKQVTTSTQNSIKVLLKRGLSQRKIATRLGVGLGTVSKYKKLLAPDILGLKRGRAQKVTESGARLIGRKFASGACTNVAAVLSTEYLKSWDLRQLENRRNQG